MLYMQCFSLTSQSAPLACVVLPHSRQRRPLAPATAARSETVLVTQVPSESGDTAHEDVLRSISNAS